MEQSFSKVIDLIYLAKQDGIDIILNDERLQLKIPENKIIDKKLLEEIRSNKNLIIDFLSNENWKSRSVSKNQHEIVPFDRNEITHIPLSFSQERLWFIDQLEGSVQYNVPTVLRLKGELNSQALSDALQVIVERHEALRTAFGEEHGQPFQYIRDHKEWKLNIVEGSSYQQDEEGLRTFIDELIKKPFDLSKDYMMRADLIKITSHEHVVVVTMHHIASDAWSLPIIVNEVIELYKANDEGRAPQLPTLDIQYADFAVWQRKTLQGDLMDRKVEYWKKKLDNVSPLQLPTDYTRPAIKTIKGATTSSRIDKDLADAIKSLGQQHGASLFMTLLTAYKVLLSRYSGQQDISVGTSIAGRKPEQVVGLIGFFANTLALRTQVNLEMSFVELLQKVKQTTMEAYDNQEVSFEKVVETVVKDRDASRSPLFQVMLVLHNTPEVPQLQLGEVQLTNEAFENNISKFDITFFFNESVNGFQWSVQYRTDLFREETITRMISHFKELLSSIVKSPDQAIGSLRILAQSEEHQLLQTFNNIRVSYPKEKTITSLFEEQAEKTPDEIALVFEEERVSYKELNERANQLAHFLRSRGVKEDTLVPLCVERSHHMLIGMLGILKAGGAYVPLEPDFPEDRKSFVLSDTDAKVIVSTMEDSGGLPSSDDVTIIEIDDPFSPFRAQPRENVQSELRPHHLAYVIYTSGSTGRPKGVMIEHRNLVDYIFGLKEAIEIDRCRSYGLVSSIATDLGNTVIYSSFVFGGELHVFSKESASNIEYLHDYFNTHDIDCLKIVPSHWKALSSDTNLLLPSILLIFGGEALSSDVVEKIRTSGSACRIVNHYGPTETTIGKLLHQVDSERKYNKTIPIGKPFSNSRVYVLSKDLELCPVGIPGQLYISGDGIARGYLNNIELTDQKFINNRFNRRDTHPMYATGDLVKWLWDGNIEFLGRADDQVKIRGYRVELGEIENILLQSGLVSNAVVLAKEDRDGNKRLVAYTVGSDDYYKESIVSYLRERLPDYMVPTQWVELESFPMLPNGKVDRKSLPDPEETEQLTKQYVAPRNEVESRLAALWQDVLEVENVGVHDDFFELGGHSLLAVRLISAIRKEFVVEMPIGDIFDYPTVAMLAQQINKSSSAVVLPPIAKVDKRPDRIPLSFSQERLWFIDRLEGSLHYHIPTVLRVKGPLNTDALTSALQEIIKRHEVLRTIIREDDGQGYQYVQEADRWYLPISDGTKYKIDPASLHSYIQKLISRPFDLSKDYMLRADLIRIDVNEYMLVSTFHHIASDGWSTSILVKELSTLYHSFDKGKSVELSPLPVQYSDYAIWQRENLQGETLENKLGYWKNKLEGVSPLQLPLDFPRPAVQSIRGDFEAFTIDAELGEQLKKLSQQHGATLFMTLLAAFKILLHRYSGQTDICVGIPVAGRQQQELEQLIGFFINTLAVRSDLTNHLSFTELLNEVKNTTLEAYAHQDLPFEKIVDATVRERVLSRTPIFQVLFTLQNTPEVPTLELGNVQLSREFFAVTTSKFDLTLSLTEVSHGLQGSILYCTDLFTSRTITRMIAHFKQLLQSIVAEPTGNIREFQILTLSEVAQLKEISTSVVDYPRDKTIIDLFEGRAHVSPGSTALVFEEKSFTYKELNERSNQLARYLQSRGVKEETLVPLCIERSAEMIIAMLGILKAGAAYVPIDADYPAERIKYMLEDTSAKIVITTAAGKRGLSGLEDVELVEIDAEWPRISEQAATDLEYRVGSRNLAYVIYTSGSTGRPKGVMIEHQALLDHCFGVIKSAGLNPCRSFALFAPLVFDAGHSMIHSAFILGASLHVISKDLLTDGERLYDYINKHEIDCIKIVPSLWMSYADGNKLVLSKKVMIFGGEPFSISILERLTKFGFSGEVYNHYGPTEATIGKCIHKVDFGRDYTIVPIGKPFSNTQLHIVDHNLNAVPVGVAGELHIAGEGLARGYLNQPALTESKFIADPFSQTPGAKMYKTGDLARWLPDGNIEYLGRIDEQMKIRGFRIEPGEIESVLQEYEQFDQAVVAVKEDSSGNKRLVGYIVPRESFLKEHIDSYLKSRLPEYMIPSIWVELESLPLTSNGKIDRKRLPNPDTSGLLANNYVAPRNEVEIAISTIWRNLLAIERVGALDNFFQLGGHSLLAMRVVSAIRKKLEVELAVKDMFLYPTVESLAMHVSGLSKGLLLPPVEVQERPRHIPLSFSQERLWFIHQLEGSRQYHVPTVLRLKGKLNHDSLNSALRDLVNRHEILRTVIREDEGRAYQHIMGKDLWNLSIIDGSAYMHDFEGLQKLIKELEIAPFDLSNDHAIRGHLIILNEQDHVLEVTLHHIASDGWSKSVLVKELLELYNARVENRNPDLPQLDIQYADFAIWQRKYFDGDVLEKKLGYWKEQLNEVTPLELPTDHTRPAVWSTRGASINFKIEKELASKLHELSQQKGVTLYMTLLAAFKVLLYRYTGQHDICVGSAIAGRQQHELESLIGFFVNTLAFRTELNPEATFSEHLRQVQQTTMDAYAHQEVPFEKVVEAVINERSLSRNPLVQVMFALLNTPQVPELRLGEIQLINEGLEHTSARFDITFFLNESPQGLQGSVEYATDLYDADTIERMIGHFKELLAHVVTFPDKKIALLPLLTPAEKNKLLLEFNKTALELPKDKTLVDLFEEVVSADPNALALSSEQGQLSYRELNERSNRLAHYLIAQGVQKQTLIPVFLERSIELFVAFLGIMKAGAAYVPIDPKYPEDRIRYMLEDTAAGIIITRNAFKSKLPLGQTSTVVVLDDTGWINDHPTANPTLDLTVSDLVNVIYTSGSTGQPKGVMVEHGGMVNMAGWYNHQFKATASSRFTTMTGVGFDAFGFEIWPALTIGAALFIVDDDTRLDTSKLIELVNAKGVTHCLVPTALIQEFVSLSRGKTKSLEFLLCGGDKLSAVDIEGLNYKVINNYGPTEYSIVATSYELTAKNKNVSPAIGSPIANTRIYITDSYQQLVPIGVAGEICLSGDSIARGYLNSEALTEEKFVNDPFSKQKGRMYKTGDIGRWLSNGHIEYIRRKDDQVKIRGHRIELGEIESVLQQTGLVSKAVVLAKEVKEGDKRLLSYLVPDWEVVKQKEHELYRNQVASWQELYDTEYSTAESEENIDTEFNIVGWNDSFTKEPIPAEQMREWLDDIVDIILSENPGNVLEIGSGSGLIYYQLAGKVKKYIGTDLSRSSINQIEKRISKGIRDYGPTELKVCAAHEVSLSENDQVDTIVINSVVQYFPGEDYLSTVIKKGISLLKGKGRIIIGDVRDNRLLRLFKGRLLMQRLQDSVSVREFNWLVDQDVLNEEELCFSPDYFYHLSEVFPEITHVQIQGKRGSYINELTLYRYNVILHVGMDPAKTNLVWQEWNDVKDDLEITNLLQKGIERIALKNAPAHRLVQERLLHKSLQQQSTRTVADLAETIRSEDSEGERLRQLLQAANERGYHYTILPNKDPLKTNVLIGKISSGQPILNEYHPDKAGAKAYTNIPLFSSISSLLQRDIRALLQQRLPEYMIPAEFLVIADLPLTRHGKVDKKFLAQRKDKATVNRLSYEAPRNEVEQVLANIWQELLGVERIGIHDNFFELGGHSLLATRAVSAVRKQLYVELFIKDLFVYPTIAELAAQMGIQTEGVMLPALEAQERTSHIPLSFSQERLWFIDRLEGSIQYHIPAQLRLKGNLDIDALMFALKNVVNRHEVLRTVVIEDNGVAYQHVMPKDGMQLSVVDGYIYKDDSEGLRNLMNRFVYDPFDLSKDHMIRALLIRLHNQEHILVVTMHHIASDGWSVSIIVREVVELYNSYKEGSTMQLAPLRIQYADFAIWQRKNIVGDVLESKIQYWKQKLHQVAPLQLPTDFTRPQFQSTKGSYANFKIDKDLSSSIVSLSQQRGATVFMTLLAAFKVLLHRYSGQQDICVGTPIAGRQQQEVEDLVGFFVNTLALRTNVKSDASFISLLEDVKATTLEAYAHQELPFEKVVDVVVKERNMSRSPLFQVMFIFQNTPEVPALRLGEVQLTRETPAHNTSKFELSFNVSQTVQGIQGSVEYCTDLYREDTIQRMIGHYLELLGAIVQKPEQEVGRLNMLPHAERQQLLIGFNNTYSEYPKNKTIVHLFEEQVQIFPSNTAVVFEGERFTYEQLNERANQLAHYLQSRGVQPDQLVPVCLERSAEMIIAILGILKAGGAYVPIDPDYPAERIQYMVEDTNASVVVAGRNTAYLIESLPGVEVINLHHANMLIDQSKTNLQTAIQPHHLAYVIYTSGSTGKPKGVLIEHRNVVRLFKTESALYDFNEKDVWSVFHSFCFDFSVWEMYGALFYGGKMVVVPKHITRDVTQFAELLIAEGVTVLNQTPSAFYVLQDALIEKTKEVAVRYVIFGGEALNPLKVQPWKKMFPNSKLVNMYGITETTVHVTYQEISWQHTLGSTSIIGKPIPTLSVYIVDSCQNLVPIGVPGELMIGGAGLARGYLNRPQLTDERFVTGSFTEQAEARLYRTGDLGSWLPDGTIEYLGRIDEQVKIRGYRIELGEIEAVIQESQLVKQAVVLAKTDKDSNKRLVGYVVADSGFNRDAIISYLQQKLPDYMVPALWVEMQNFPLTSNGKIDKKSLPEPDASTLIKTEYVAPRTEMEQALAQIWCDLLGLKVVGIEDNFFELGGDSILTIQVVSRARRLGYELQPRDIFLHQTISHLSDAILKQSAAKIVGEQGILTGACGLTPIQEWFLQEDRKSRSHFNQSVLLGIDKSVSSPILEVALEKLIAQHDALRFKYSLENGTWLQEYSDHYPKLVVEDLRMVPFEDLSKVITEKANLYQRKLNIEKGELIQVVWMQTPQGEKQNRLLFVVHHLAIDGVSWRILVENLEFLLTSLQRDQKIGLGVKTSSYRQWYHALCEYAQRPRVLSQVTYWEKVLNSYRPLTRDKSNAGVVRFSDMASHVMSLGVETTTKLLQDVPKVYHTEINDLLLCALAMTLNKWGDTEKIVVGLEGHGREEISKSIDITQTVGWFTSLYPVLIEMPGGQHPDTVIKSVKEQLRQVPDKGLGYGVLKYINKEEKLNGKERWHILFNYLGQFDNVIKTGQWLSGVRESAGQRVSDDHVLNEQLQVTAYIQGGQLVLNWIYNSGNYDGEDISDLVKSYHENLELLIDHCINKQKSGSVFTPSDYGLGAEIPFQELDRFLEEPYRGIPRRESLDGMYRLSGLQQGMLFHGLYNEKGGSYIDQFSCDLAAPDLDAFTKSWKKIIQHHSILRSAFYSDVFSVPVQCVYRNAELPLDVIDYRHLNNKDQAEAIKKYSDDDRVNGFDFKLAPLMRVALFRLKDDQYRMLWTSHHLLFDGWSMPILMEEFLSSYELLIAGKELEEPKEDRYEDYIRYLERSSKEDEEAYWRNYMSGIEQSTLIPFVELNTPRRKGAGDFQMHYLHLDAAVTDKVKTYSQTNRVTVNTIMQGVWSYLLHQYTGNRDVCYGVVVSGRPDDLPGVEQRVGMYINTLPLHSRKKHDEQISDWLQRIQDDQVSSRQYQFTPLQNIQLLSNVKGDLFDTILVFENYPVSKVVSEKKWSLDVRNVQMKEQTNYPLTITVGSADQISVVFHYNSYLLKDEIIHQIGGHFENVLLQLIQNDSKKVSDIQLLTKKEEELIIGQFNSNISEFPGEQNIVDVFEAQVASTPDRIALVYEESYVTYRELNERSNKVAHYLISKGVQKETLVPLCIEKSLNMMVGILGILKAGGAYVPLDSSYPEQRINLMLEDTDAQIILTDKASRSKLKLTRSIEAVELDDESIVVTMNGQSPDNPQVGVQASQLAYIMYTSGSTGRPKGVLVEHGNVVSLVKGVDYVTISKEDILLSTGSASFDATTFEYWAMLLHGGQLVLCKESRLLDAALLKKEISEKSITIMWFTSSWFNQLVETDMNVFSGLKTILVGGEKLSEYHIRKMKARFPAITLINGYGPTENTTFSLTYRIGEIEEGKSIPIGRPLSNRTAYILNDDLHPLPVGVTGEIYLGGAGVARGYLNSPELSKEKFIDDRFSGKQGSKLYKTGDLGRWLPDGSIEYQGRIDDQVKIRGFRIELDEINSVLQQSNLVSQSIVIVKTDEGGNKRLVGFVVPQTGFTKEAISTYLQSRLPDYMVPRLWVELTSLPLTSNGKVDKRSLPDPEVAGSVSDQYLAPRTEIEISLIDIWKKLLRVERVGVKDNFFELGGHSLLGMRLLSVIRKEFGVDIPLVEIFDTTVEVLAQKISDLQRFGSGILQVLEKSGDAQPFKEVELGQRVEAGLEWGHNENGRYMIPLSTNGNRIPFFGIISFNSYRLLGKYMTEDQPLYYLPPTQAASVIDIATHYVKEIKLSQPTGPYIVGGFCGGGKIALEVAHQLEAQGDHVAALVLFEFYSPRAAMSKKTLTYKKRRLAYYKNRILTLSKEVGSPVDLVKYVVDKSLRKLRKPISKPAPPKYITNPEYRRYQWKPYGGKVILFQASITPLEYNGSPIMGWEGFFTGDVEVVQVQGGHLGIFREPAVKKLAEKVAEALEEVNEVVK